MVVIVVVVIFAMVIIVIVVLVVLVILFLVIIIIFILIVQLKLDFLPNPREIFNDLDIPSRNEGDGTDKQIDRMIDIGTYYRFIKLRRQLSKNHL